VYCVLLVVCGLGLCAEKTCHIDGASHSLGDHSRSHSFRNQCQPFASSHALPLDPLTAETAYSWSCFVLHCFDHLCAGAVYAFGITVCELISRKEPYSTFDGQTFEEIRALVSNPGPDSSLIRPHIPDSCPEELRKIIQECWAHHADNRPTFVHLAMRVRSLDLSAFGTGSDNVHDILFDMYPPHVRITCLHSHMPSHGHGHGLCIPHTFKAYPPASFRFSQDVACSARDL
jgi:hypothetical protein